MLIPEIQAIAKKMDGMKAIPPRRGIVPLCIFLGSGSSNSLRRNLIQFANLSIYFELRKFLIFKMKNRGSCYILWTVILRGIG